MLKKIYTLSNRSYDKGLLLLFLISLLWLKEINYLFYNINESPDFKKYFVYFDHFFLNSYTGHEHGLLYYYLHSIHLNTFFQNQPSLDLALHKSVLDVNFYMFVVGLLGIFKLLKFFKFSNKSILITLIFLNFFPPSIAIRLVFKPELLAFSLFPWIIYLFEKFKESKNYIYLIMAVPIVISTITLKGNILVITCVYLLFSNYKIFSMLQFKTIAYFSFVFITLFTLLTLENNKANGKNILDIQSGASQEANYDFKAPKSIVYKTDMYELFSNPIKHKHADSFIAITLLETNGDYFDLYWDNNASQYFKSRLEFFVFEQSNELKFPNLNFEDKTITIYQQRSTDVYLYETIALILSILLFSSLINALISAKKYRMYLIAIFIGMGVILIHAITGYPTNNFDPLVGDTFKPLYYSFVMLFSVSFMVSIFSEKNSFKIRHLLLYGLLIVFILGFPKNDYSEVDGSFLQKVENSIFCELEKNIYLENTIHTNLVCKNNTDQTNTNFFISDISHKPVNLFFIFANVLVLTFLLLENNLAFLSSKRKFIKDNQ